MEFQKFLEAKALVTPTHIQPEWYFLPSYAVLRSIPNKFGGVVALFVFLGILFILPFFKRKSIKKNFSFRGIQFSGIYQLFF